MSDDYITPTSPTIPVDDGIVHSQKQFSDVLTQDLTDDEIKSLFETVEKIASKWRVRFIRKFSDTSNFTPEDAVQMVDEMEEEIKYELATKLDIYADMDCTPIFDGRPPIIDIKGALPSHRIAKYGFDHEKKTYEVRKATDRGEDFLGQKGTSDATKAKKRAKG